ncbi:hypothetical protein [Burkholderia puraquae]|uniref:hypothetical protein n=1 Tax=Burkholderia puraquae TaxID=1904757 RepID=UPI001FCBA8F6|nr:hypothetical protein [Burkholderia puraquae]
MTHFALLYPERFIIGVWVSTRLAHEIPDTADGFGSEDPKAGPSLADQLQQLRDRRTT